MRIVSSAAFMPLMPPMLRMALGMALGMALATSAFAQTETPPQYSQVRQDHPGIDEAVAEMPNSDFHGTINRLSALWNRGQIRDLTTGQGGQLPANFVKNLEATLIDLRDDLREDELQTLSAEQGLYILHVIEVYAFHRTLDLNGAIPCFASPPGCGDYPSPACCTITPVNVTLVEIAGIARSLYGRVRLAVCNPCGELPLASAVNANTLHDVLADSDLLTLVLGVEHIDH